VLHCGAVRCSVSQCVAVCYSKYDDDARSATATTCCAVPATQGDLRRRDCVTCRARVIVRRTITLTCCTHTAPRCERELQRECSHLQQPPSLNLRGGCHRHPTPYISTPTRDTPDLHPKHQHIRGGCRRHTTQSPTTETPLRQTRML